MRKILVALASIVLTACVTTPAEAGAYRTCPGGLQVRKPKACPTPTGSGTIPVFAVQSVTVNETVGTATVTVTKSGGNGLASSVTYQTADMTALAGSDYTAVASTTVSVSATQTSFTVSVPITNDSAVEANEAFAVRITAASNGSVTQNGVVTIVSDDVATPPTTQLCPDGTTIPVGDICPGLTLAGATPIADNFDVSTWLIAGEGPHISPDAVGAFRFTCLGGHLSKNDPLVYPGQLDASHIHQFFGNTGTDQNSNYTSLRTTGGSTCTRSLTESPQRTAYWMPAMLDGVGNAVKADWMNTYYKQLPKTDPECAITLDPTVVGHCIPIPNGIRFILGYNMATGVGGPTDTNSRDYWAMGFDCMDHVIGNTSLTGFKHSLAEIWATGLCPVGSWLRVAVTFPQCWNGKDLDSANHRDHIIYPPQSRCPGSHPYKVPEVAVSAFFTVDANFATWHLSSDDMLPVGSPAGKSLHMDYWEAWSPIVKPLWQNCIDGHLSCSTGNIGDGRMISGMQQVGPFPNHILVPVNTIP
jgi:hypothetical protein